MGKFARNARLACVATFVLAGVATSASFGHSVVAASQPAPGSGTTTPGDGELRALVVAAPYPSCVLFWPFFLGEEKGYFADAGLTVSVEGLDGSGALLQAVLADQADVGLPAAGSYFQAVEEGGDVISIYTIWHNEGLNLVVPTGSEITSLEDLRGKTIGATTMDSGEVPSVRSILAGLGMTEGEDYELLPVGGGATALVALDRGDIDAYSSYFTDIAVMELQDADITDLIADTQRIVPSPVVVRRQLLTEEPDVVVGFGRALVRATQYGMDHPDEITAITNPHCPEEAQDAPLTEAFVSGVNRMMQLPPSADGQWGFTDQEAMEVYIADLLAAGEIQAAPDPELYSNDLIDDFNSP